MKDLSKQAGLVGSYTNHSIHSTAITKLDGCDVEARHIQAVSGHKSEAKIKTYAKKCSSNKKRQMFNILDIEKSFSFPPPAKIPILKATATISKPPDNNDNTNQINDSVDFLDFVPIDNNANDFDLVNILENIEKKKTLLTYSKNLQKIPRQMTQSSNSTDNRTNCTTNIENATVPVAFNNVVTTNNSNCTTNIENATVPVAFNNVVTTNNSNCTTNIENATVPVAFNNVVTTNNFTQMQNQPILPRMIFQNSNVTVNNNFNK